MGRLRVHGNGRPEKQNKRAATSFQDKHAVIQHYDKSHDMSATMLHFFPDMTEAERRAKARVVYRWIQLKDDIAAHASSAKTKHQSRVRPAGSATTLGLDGEMEVVEWVQTMRRQDIPVSSEMLRVKALEVATARGVPAGAFAASGTWQKSFVARNRKYMDASYNPNAKSDDSPKVEEEVEDTSIDVTSDASALPSIGTNDPPVQTTAGPQTAAPLSVQLVTPVPVPVPNTSIPATSSISNSTSTSISSTIRPHSRNAPLRGSTLTARAVEPSKPSPTAPALLAAPVAPSPPATVPTTAAASPVLTPVAIAPFTVPPVAPAAVAVPSSLPAPSTDTATAPNERDLTTRKAEIEDRKAELLNESIRCDNVLKRIRIAEENMLARKRLKDAGIPQDEIDAMLPIQRE